MKPQSRNLSQIIFNLSKLALAASLCLFLVLPELSSESSTASPGVAPDISLTLSSSGALNLTLEPGTFSTVSDALTISTSNYTGYTLSLETSSDSTSLTHTGNSTYSIPTLSTSATTSSFPDGYGYSTDSTTFSPVPASKDILASTSVANSSPDTLTLTFGAKVPLTQASGTYENTFLLTATANDVNYEVTYDPNASSDTVLNMPSPLTQSGSISGLTLYLDSTLPRRSGYDFLGWATSPGATEPDAPRSSLTYPLDPETANPLTLYAVWAENTCPSNYICYNGNGDDGTGEMPNQSASSNTATKLTPSNFSLSGYGFAGWNTEMDGSGSMYGPEETITTPDLSLGGLKLYATWIPSAGILQNWNGCSKMSVGDVTALTDFRDGETYLVSKLADNNCWTSENFRINPRTAKLSPANTNSPTKTFLNLASVSAPTNSFCASNTETCINTVAYNLNNMNRSLTQSTSDNTPDAAWYSYGGMYNWFTTTAGNGTFSNASGSISGDLCPSDWRIASGGTGGEYTTLASALNPNSLAGDTALRIYPANYIRSGDYNTNYPTGRGTQARFWSATAYSTIQSYRLGYNATEVSSVKYYNKWDAFSIRCLAISASPQTQGNIAYDSNGGSGSMSPDLDINLYRTAAKSNTFTRSGYVFSRWNTSPDGSGTDVLDGDLVAEAASALNLSSGDTLTLYAIWGETFTLNYDANGGENAPAPTTGIGVGSFDFVITSAQPTRDDYAFVGWAASSSAPSAEYTSGDTLSTSSVSNTLYAVWEPVSCKVNSICYRANNADAGNTIAHTANSNSSTILMPSDFSRAGYGFLGWSTTPDGSGTILGPMSNYTTGDLTSEGLVLYATWLLASDTMQNFTTCSDLSTGDTVALTDERDDNTYAVVKLADGKCWMMENLRLDPSAVTLTAQNTHAPTETFISEAAASSSSTSLCNKDQPSCLDTVQYNTDNINRSYSTHYNNNSEAHSLFSYGVWYNWYTATAGNGTSTFTTNNVPGDLCPYRWRLPTGGSGGETAALNTLMNSGRTNTSIGLRAYPVNLVYAGDLNGSKRQSRGVYARYWTATAATATNAYRLGLNATEVTPLKNYNKWDAFTIRCVTE